MAAGSSSLGTLIEEWDGATWSIVSSPNTSGTNNGLGGVSCTSANFCMATGSSSLGTLIEEWDGATWSIVSSPNTSGTNNSLGEVSCTSANFCMATGSSSLGTLIEEWDGATWSIVSSPNTGTLVAVSCNSATLCMADGYYQGSGAAEQTLIEEWDGTSWSIVSTPNSSAYQNFLQGVSCGSAYFCVATGYDYDGSAFQTLIEEWQGSTTQESTVPTRSSITLGQPNTDAATVIGDAAEGSPTGSMTFFSCGPLASASGCPTGGTVVGNPVTLTAGANDTATATSSTVTPVAVGTWCFRGVYSGDVNYAASSDGGPAECFAVNAPTTFQDSSSSLPYNSWHGFTDSTASGGTYRASATKAAKVTFKFSATGITWVTRKGPDQGIASVTIDGTSKGSVDLYSASPQSFSQSYSGLASKTHTIVISVSGTKNAASSGKQVAVDAFVVGFTTTEDTSTKVMYDTWKGVSSTSASGGTYRVSPKQGATSRLSFTGERVDWSTATGPSAGKASVTIDGVSMGTIDLYAPSVHWQVLESYGGLAPGSHTVVVTVLGTKNASSAGTLVIVDAFVVYS
jgi:hypothetical protein